MKEVGDLLTIIGARSRRSDAEEGDPPTAASATRERKILFHSRANSPLHLSARYASGIRHRRDRRERRKKKVEKHHYKYV